QLQGPGLDPPRLPALAAVGGGARPRPAAQVRQRLRQPDRSRARHPGLRVALRTPAHMSEPKASEPASRAGPEASETTSRAEPATQVVVIGAGPAGLTAAYELGKRGETCTVLEA